MDESKDRTLKEWREQRGLSREELAERTGVDAVLLARLEEVGDPTYADTIEGDAFLKEVIGPIMEVLGLEEGVAMDKVPIDAAAGAYVLDPGALSKLDEDVECFLAEHAEEIGLRVAVPNRWDVGLKPYADLEEADYEAIVAYKAREIAHNRAIAEYARNMYAMLTEHATDENQKTGDVLEERGGRWVPKRQRSPKEEDEG